MKKCNKSIITVLILASLGILISIYSLGLCPFLLNEISKVGIFLANRGPIEKFVIVCILSWLIFSLSAKRIIQTYFQNILIKASVPGATNHSLSRWLANKTHGLPDREHRLMMSILNQSGECIGKHTSEVIGISENALIHQQPTGSFQVLVAEWINNKKSGVRIVNKSSPFLP